MHIHSFGSKIGAGYLLITVIFSLAFLFTVLKVEEIRERAELTTQQEVPTALESINIKVHLYRSLSALTAWSALGSERHLEELRNSWKELDRAVISLDTLKDNTGDQLLAKDLDKLKGDINQLIGYQKEVQQIARTPDNHPGLKLLLDRVIPLNQKLTGQITSIIELEVKEPANLQRRTLLKSMADYRGATSSAIASARAYLLSSDESLKQDFIRKWSQASKNYEYLQDNADLLTKQQTKNLERIRNTSAELQAFGQKVFDLRGSIEWDISKSILNSKIAPLEVSIKRQVDRIVDREQRVMSEGFIALNKEFEALWIIVLAALIGGAVLSTVLGIMITRMVVSPIDRVVSIARAISEGDFNIDARFRGAIEIEKLSDALRAMIEMLRKVERYADGVARGEYSTQFEPKSQKDQLGNALKTMSTNLMQATARNEAQSWIKSGQTGLSSILSKLGSDQSISQSLLNYICDYFNVATGAVYVLNNSQYHFAAGYAYTERSSRKSFKPGEGLIGQVVVERKIKVFSDIAEEDDSLLYTDSGLHEGYTRHLLLAPVMSGQSKANNVVGAIALGSHRPFGQEQIELIRILAEMGAISLESEASTEKLESLLAATQAQAEELHCQKEELKLANEELETQARALKQSEEELRTQSSNLLAVNRDLEEKSAQLQRQKASVELKNKEIEMARSELEFKASELELASRYKSEFLANMSHELRTPLNSLMILSQSLASNSDGNLNEEQVEDLGIIYSGGKTLLSLINDILDLSKVEAGKLEISVETVCTQNLVEQMRREFMTLAASKGITFTLECAAEVPEFVQADQMRTCQILRNLLGNAFKFTNAGEVRLSVYLEEESQPGNPPQLAFAVKDTGPGIPAERQRDIFEAFKQLDGSTNRKFGGTGLGLTISRELAKLLNGDIQLQSIEGQGAEFTLRIPTLNYIDSERAEEPHLLETAAEMATQERTTQESKTQERTEVISGSPDSLSGCQGGTIFVVDDDAVFSRFVERHAVNRGFNVRIMADGQTLLDAIREEKPDGIILDIGLPDMDGRDLLETLKSSADTASIPVHLISAWDEAAIGDKSQAIGYFTKSDSPEEMNDVLDRLESGIKSEIRKVLIIEDEESCIHAIKRTLKGRHVELIFADSGREALKILETVTIDCMVLDLKLPDMSGEQLLQKAEEMVGVLPPIVVHTASELSEQDYRNLLAYTNRMVIKGVDAPKRLYDEVMVFLSGIDKKSAGEIQPHTVSTNKLRERNVLLVDDDLRNTYALSKVLKKSGLNVFIADNGEMALSKLSKTRDIDLILMDVMMPVMDGYETSKQIKQLYGDQYPIIALTAKAMPGDEDKCLESGMNGYITKPVDVNHLLGEMEAYC
ncbi:response regulator [Marinobacterium jannaschii]|uniref:response regulator n=1 Tax=Marinobacterium jannaschii TaxID=64970 RepID=UPI00068489F6|nr:response regulator [Marinobacterium jannaschii]